MSGPISQANSAAVPSAVEEVPKEESEELEDLSTVLEHLGLCDYQSTFEQEKIDIESFVRTLLLVIT